jgi:hypothetical protein
MHPDTPKATKARLEIILQPKLNLPGCGGTIDTSEVWRVEIPLRVVQIDVVKGIEELNPELKPVRFSYHEVLKETQRPGLIVRADDKIPPRISKRVGCWFRKDGAVEPAVGGRAIDVRVAIQIRPLADGAGADVGDIPRDGDIERLSRAGRDDPVELPSAQDMIGSPGQVSAVWLAFSEGQFVDKVHGEQVFAMERRKRPVALDTGRILRRSTRVESISTCADVAAESVSSHESQPLREPLFSLELDAMIDGAANVCHQTGSA